MAMLHIAKQVKGDEKEKQGKKEFQRKSDRKKGQIMYN